MSVRSPAASSVWPVGMLAFDAQLPQGLYLGVDLPFITGIERARQTGYFAWQFTTPMRTSSPASAGAPHEQ